MRLDGWGGLGCGCAVYRIIGADQQQYGPVSLEVLRQWIAENRVNAQTLVQAEGSSEWRPLGSVPELAALLPQAPVASVPPGAAGPVPVDTEARVAAGRAVRTPAILLIIGGALGLAGGVATLLQFLMGIELVPLPPDMPPELVRLVRQFMGLPLAVINLAASGLVLLGGISMLRLRTWGLAVAGSIAALLFGNPCCCPLGLVGGIWGLVRLFEPAVKAAFE